MAREILWYNFFFHLDKVCL